MLELITITDLTSDYRGFRCRTARGVAFSRLRFAIMHGNGNIILVLDEQLSGLSEQQVDGVLGVRSGRAGLEVQLRQLDIFECLSTIGRRVGPAKPGRKVHTRRRRQRSEPA